MLGRVNTHPVNLIPLVCVAHFASNPFFLGLSINVRVVKQFAVVVEFNCSDMIEEIVYKDFEKT